MKKTHTHIRINIIRLWSIDDKLCDVKIRIILVWILTISVMSEKGSQNVMKLFVFDRRDGFTTRRYRQNREMWNVCCYCHVFLVYQTACHKQFELECHTQRTFFLVFYTYIYCRIKVKQKGRWTNMWYGSKVKM